MRNLLTPGVLFGWMVTLGLWMLAVEQLMGYAR